MWRSSGELGEEVRRIRRRLRMSQAEFAEALGMKPPGGQTIVSGWERGRGIADDSLEKIAKLAEVPLSVFQESTTSADRPVTPREVMELEDRLRSAQGAIEAALKVVDDAMGRMQLARRGSIPAQAEYRPRRGKVEKETA